MATMAVLLLNPHKYVYYSTMHRKYPDEAGALLLASDCHSNPWHHPHLMINCSFACNKYASLLTAVVTHSTIM